MKKYLLLMLLTPLAYAEVQEFYCEEFERRFLTLKINTNLNNPIFTIENAFGLSSFNKYYARKDIVIEKLVVKVSDDENQKLYMFNRATNVLSTVYVGKKKDYIESTELLKRSYIAKGHTYRCIEIK
tara:strand:- start:111 stop:491 length:381 start_codon:yes stop_codon:yes gene_type:complete